MHKMSVVTGPTIHSMKYMTVIIAKPSAQQVKQEVAAMNRVARDIASTRQKARSYLIEKGFITKANKLTKKYS